ncbi:hypothetical protein U5640_04045 [Streptomyces sp. SS7]|uniref:hypothetical protein n=1 Tax=Streptomyces sp. SS7 TaxID=3108485 RepID=UPI0030EB6BE2
MDGDGAAPVLGEGEAGADAAARVDEGAVLLDVASGEKSEDFLVYAGERLEAGAVEAEAVVGADVLVAGEGVGGVLDAHAGRVFEAGEAFAALPVGQAAHQVVAAVIDRSQS